jgi:hypothetical protein
MVYSSAGGQVKGVAVARLYMSQGNAWSYSHLWGAAALVALDGIRLPLKEELYFICSRSGRT